MATCEEDSSDLLKDIDNLTKSAVTDCATTLREALDRFEEHHSSLRSGGSGKRLKDAIKKLKWLGEKENVERIQQKLRTGTERINVLLIAACRVSARENGRTVVSRLDVVYDLLSEQLNDYKATVTKLEDKLQNSHDDIGCRLTTIERSLDSQEATMRTSLFYAKSGLDATRCLQQIFSQMFQYILNFQFGAVLNLWRLDPTKGLPVTLEDALGNVREVPLDWVNSWEALHSLIANSFQNHKGWGLVQRKQYALEDSISGRELDLQSPFSLRRGMKINMSMVFASSRPSRCPRCRVSTTAEEGHYTQCASPGCGFSFKMISEVAQPATSIQKGPFIFRKVAGTRMTGTEHGLRDGEPADFCRVRLVLQRGKYLLGPTTSSVEIYKPVPGRPEGVMVSYACLQDNFPKERMRSSTLAVGQDVPMLKIAKQPMDKNDIRYQATKQAFDMLAHNWEKDAAVIDYEDRYGSHH